jgi:hypothetical protein
MGSILWNADLIHRVEYCAAHFSLDYIGFGMGVICLYETEHNREILAKMNVHQIENSDRQGLVYEVHIQFWKKNIVHNAKPSY